LNLLLPDALKTGNLTLVPNAVVRELSVDKKTGKVNGAHFVDRVSKREFHVKAKVVVLGASTLESTRILLNSNLANSSGTLGRYLFDQFYVKNMGGGGYIPRFRNLKEKSKDFIRGYAYDFGSGNSPGPQYFPAYGEQMWKQMADTQGAGFNLTTMGEVLPRYESVVRINKTKTDAWGIPVLHIQQKYTENEFAMAKDSMNTAAQLCSDSGFEILAKHWEMVPPGESIHELGTCRMGSDPKKSVLNGWNQTHDVKNLFVVDGGAFVSGGAQNPTLTILALTMRASEYLFGEAKKGNL
jgi:choline dehydrogenase-like flavoprotein